MSSEHVEHDDYDLAISAEESTCPGCGDPCTPESLPFTRVLRWACCGYREAIDPFDNPDL